MTDIITSLKYSENKEHIYQKFIFYLNKTISKSKTTSSTSLNDIIYDFINKFIPQTLRSGALLRRSAPRLEACLRRQDWRLVSDVEVGGFASDPKELKSINMDPFQKLLLFYLNSKKISPIMINYIPLLSTDYKMNH
uniref:Uncharacterized protein n=1 Tax=Mimivirus LCMiAC02 TaxID=2506609 RepID=A0A4P6VS93_9VIRU|nr:MAG: hypothetical protein LCMiAC02_05060 [Mimivirus LCMiAC02]